MIFNTIIENIRSKYITTVIKAFFGQFKVLYFRKSMFDKSMKFCEYNPYIFVHMSTMGSLFY